MDWTSNRKVHFAIGLTVLIIAIRFVLTGDLLLAYQAYTQPPPKEGETQSLTVAAVLWPMFVELCVWIGASVLLWGLKIWQWLYDRVHGDSESQASSVAGTAAAVSADGLGNRVLQAMALNDSDAIERYKKEVRKPYALQDLMQAYEEGDLDAVKDLHEELETLVVAKPTRVRKVVSDE